MTDDTAAPESIEDLDAAIAAEFGADNESADGLPTASTIRMTRLAHPDARPARSCPGQ